MVSFEELSTVLVRMFARGCGRVLNVSPPAEVIVKVGTHFDIDIVLFKVDILYPSVRIIVSLIEKFCILYKRLLDVYTKFEKKISTSLRE